MKQLKPSRELAENKTTMAICVAIWSQKQQLHDTNFVLC
jgi:hypothetical protein